MCHFTSFAARQNLLSPSFPLVVVSDGPPIVLHVLSCCLGLIPKVLSSQSLVQMSWYQEQRFALISKVFSVTVQTAASTFECQD